MTLAKTLFSSLAGLALAALLVPGPVWAMCGGIMPKRPDPKKDPELVALAAKARITNQSSKVILARDGDQTVMTMTNDFKGPFREFAMVIPIPTPIQKKDVKVVEPVLFDKLAQATAPTLQESWDPDPCPQPAQEIAMADAEEAAPAAAKSARGSGGPKASQYGVKVEAHFSVGEYEIAILKGTDSKKLIEWLNIFKYDIPQDAKPIIDTYLKQDMRFFVTRVNLKEANKSGYQYLRPLQISYQTPKFMLPIRMGMMNADGPQELHVFALTRKGRVETTNYRTVKLDGGQAIPATVKKDFNGFVRAFFDEATRREDSRVVFTEYAGRALGALPPGASEPLLRPVDPGFSRPTGLWKKDLIDSGARWLNADNSIPFLTRLHFKYDAERFVDDLVLNETGDQGAHALSWRIRHPWRGSPDRCPQAKTYLQGLVTRFDAESSALASLTGWPIQKIRDEMNYPKGMTGAPPPPPGDPEDPTAPTEKEKEPWYKRLWDSISG
jgi:hypothetical protein